MRAPGTGLLRALLIASAVAACSSTSDVELTDIDIARRAWVDANVRNYRFEVATATSWFPRQGFVQVRVEDGQVVSAVDSTGTPRPGFTLTIEHLWAAVLAARTSGQLHSATFSRQGVPLETNYGPWEVDGGVAHSVRNFERLR